MAVAGGAAVLAACEAPGTPASPSASGQTSAKPAGTSGTEIRIQTVTQPDMGGWIEEALKQDIDGRKAKQPNVNVKVETFGAWTDKYLPEMEKVWASGTPGDLVWYPPRHRSHLLWGARRNLVRDLTSDLRAQKYDLGQFFKASIDQNSDAGKVFFLPYVSEPVCPIVAINKGAIQSAGLPVPTDDWTFDDLAEWGQKAAGRSLYGYFRADSGNDAFTSSPYLRQWGVEPVDPTGRKATFAATRDAFVQALTYRANLVGTWKVSPPVSPPPDYINLFGQQQKLLAMDGWPVRIGWLPKQFKSLDIDFVLTPTVRKGDRRRSLLNEHVFGVTKGSKNPEEALSVLLWLASKEMAVQGVVQGFKGPNARIDAWSDARVLDRSPAYKKMRTVMEAIEPDYFVGNYRGEEFDAATNWGAVERGETSPAAMVDQIQKLAQEVLDRQPVA
jgi:ABC-type glycerol-3-phosphate transport system substrate-binding protein